MKSLLIRPFLCATAGLLLGCRSVPTYSGEGQLANTTTWHDGLIRIPEYTIRLVSFGLNTNVSREFYLGDVAFFRKTTLAVYLRFTDTNSWEHFSRLSPSERSATYAQDHRLRDLDKLESHLSYQVSTGPGGNVFRSDQLLRDYVWGEHALAGGVCRYDIYDRANARTEIAGGTALNLKFSYRGDASLTNQAELVLVCWPR